MSLDVAGKFVDKGKALLRKINFSTRNRRLSKLALTWFCKKKVWGGGGGVTDIHGLLVDQQGSLGSMEVSLQRPLPPRPELISTLDSNRNLREGLVGNYQETPLISCSVIVRVSVVLKRTVGDSD